MMALSDSQMKFKKIPRNSLFYNQYLYCATWHLPHAHMLRVLSQHQVLERITYRNSVTRQMYKQRPVLEDQAQALLEACDYLTSRPNPFRKNVSSGIIWFYTNNPEDFARLDVFEGARVESWVQADVCLEPGVITLNNPQHQYRTFFRERWLSQDQLTAIKRYFSTRPGQFRLSPGFRMLIEGTRMWMTANHFVDHDEPLADFLINLACPGIVRKTLPIVARAK